MSPRSPVQFEEMREEKRNLIMDTALEHFSDIGFHTTTISHIARHAGISKGLMYNYFKSKDDLLVAIVNRSLTDIYNSFDPNRDGYLSEDEFELFLRKVFYIFREKRRFWKLLYRMMMQKGVYENLFNEKFGSISVSGIPLKEFSENMMRQLTDYFNRKKEAAGPDYDPVIEMLMFSNTVKGFSMTYIFSDDLYPDEYFEKMIEALIKRYR